MIVLSCQGFRINKFRIPAFELNEGEIVTLNLWSGGHFFDLENELVSIFTGKSLKDQVILNKQLMFAEHIHLKNWKEKFYSLTVERYLRKNAEPTEMSLSVFPDDRLNPKTKVSHLAGNPRRFLSIYATLSKCDSLIFDLVGVDPQGALDIYRIVEDYVKSKSGSAILLNNFDDMKNRCEKHYDIEVLKE